MATQMIPLLAVALLVLTGVFAFTFGLERKVNRLEKRLDQVRSSGSNGEDR